MHTCRNYITCSPEETFAFGCKLAREFSPGDIVILDGELGAGKTLLTSGIASGLGYDGLVNSPTYTLLNHYIGGKIPLYHFDLYRLQSFEEFEDIGGWDYLENPESICLIEWGMRFAPYFPPESDIIKLRIIDTNQRAIDIEPLRT